MVYYSNSKYTIVITNMNICIYIDNMLYYNICIQLLNCNIIIIYITINLIDKAFYLTYK